MRVQRIVIVIMTALAVSACSSTVSTLPDIPADTRARIGVTEAVATTSAYSANARFDVPRLAEAVSLAAASRPGGDIPVRLAVTVTRYEIVHASERLFRGVFAGWNKLYVAVDVVDLRNGTVLGTYAVHHEENPDSDGAFYDQSQPLIVATAERVLEGLYGVCTPKPTIPVECPVE